MRRVAVSRVRRPLSDDELLVLSMAFAFCIWFGGGWLLAGQLAIRDRALDTSDVLPDGGHHQDVPLLTPDGPDEDDWGASSPSVPTDPGVDPSICSST